MLLEPVQRYTKLNNIQTVRITVKDINHFTAEQLNVLGTVPKQACHFFHFLRFAFKQNIESELKFRTC